jgi:hypothetical protein
MAAPRILQARRPRLIQRRFGPTASTNESPRMVIRRLLDPDAKGPGVQQGGDGHENETKADKSPDPAIAPAQHAALRPKFAAVILCSFS